MNVCVRLGCEWLVTFGLSCLFVVGCWRRMQLHGPVANAKPAAMPNGPYRIAAERESVFIAAKVDFEDLVAVRRGFELRLRALMANSTHGGECGRGAPYYCCRGRTAILRVLDTWDSGGQPTEAELMAAESFMSDKP
jgi:hypothetical protein